MVEFSLPSCIVGAATIQYKVHGTPTTTCVTQMNANVVLLDWMPASAISLQEEHKGFEMVLNCMCSCIYTCI